VLASDRRVTTRYGGTSAQLVRWAIELAEEWRSMVRYALPVGPIDRRPARSDDPDHTPTGETIDDVLAGRDAGSGTNEEGGDA
jgi:hypothetical protein